MAESSERTSPKVVYSLGVVALLIAVLLIVFMLVTKHRAELKERDVRRAGIKAGSHVQVAFAGLAPTSRSVSFTGEARPFVTATLYAKVSGYLKEINVDKGDRVEQGRVLARITSPELDSQYFGALADATNKRNFARRELALLKEGIISQQEADDAVTAARSAEATAAALKTQRGYQVITAPFSGVVTARFADPGALLQSATAGQTAALPLVTLSRIDRLRIFVYLDQKSASQVKTGDQAQVADSTRPQLKLPARVTRISGELDPRSRTMLCELDMPNPKQRLLAGGFVQVTLTVSTPQYVQVPAAAVYEREEKSYVAIIGSNNRVHFQTVTVADSNGKEVRISEGVQKGDLVALNPGTGLTEGDVVQPVLEKEKQQQEQ
jgi:membrane fusion protein, multidrug efflux system